MKLKTKIDISDKKDLDIIVQLADFMFLFFGQKSSAHKLADDAEEIIENDFCRHCESHLDGGCECSTEHHREYEPDWDDEPYDPEPPEQA